MAKYGVHIINADDVYREIIVPPSECLCELAENYGSQILKDDGTLDRVVLSGLVFGETNKSELEALNRITHKYVVREIRERVSNLKLQDGQICAIDAPLLIEAGLRGDCDITLSVLADADIRAKRISVRDGIDIQAARQRICSQKSDTFYIENTDNAVYNNGDEYSLGIKILKLLDTWGVPI